MATLDTTVTEPKTKSIDPVCGMEVDPGSAKFVSVHKGNKYWFCAEACRRAFEADPEKYLKPKPAKKKGLIGRYLDRLARTNQKEFGSAGPRCCH